MQSSSEYGITAAYGTPMDLDPPSPPRSRETDPTTLSVNGLGELQGGRGRNWTGAAAKSPPQRAPQPPLAPVFVGRSLQARADRAVALLVSSSQANATRECGATCV